MRPLPGLPGALVWLLPGLLGGVVVSRLGVPWRYQEAAIGLPPEASWALCLVCIGGLRSPLRCLRGARMRLAIYLLGGLLGPLRMALVGPHGV